MRWLCLSILFALVGCSNRFTSFFKGNAVNVEVEKPDETNPVLMVSSWLIYAGSPALFLGIVIVIASFFFQIPSRIRHLAGAVAATGAGCLVAGSTLSFIGAYYHVIIILSVLVSILTGAIYLYANKWIIEKLINKDIDGDGKIGK